ncbi:hypothetical protein [Paenibacillus allorhizoplanae]|uniref:hypothetical protein n=1 Tax=Paenibacillus allorhizoplanae TaxID=2905648 RepID=UPI001F3F80DA|nr:hypothetical protein [Paenibacillus allorhizoplanae]
MKAGVVDREPSVIKDSAIENTPYYRLNLDKGNQSTDGKEVALLGNIAKPDAEKSGFQLKSFERTFQVKSILPQLKQKKIVLPPPQLVRTIL